MIATTNTTIRLMDKTRLGAKFERRFEAALSGNIYIIKLFMKKKSMERTQD